VLASVTYTLASNVENLTLTGTAAINGVGNTLANILTGNSGNNILDGGSGADTLVGSTGNDTYVVDNTADVTTENASEGTDLVQSSVTYTLASNIENLTLTTTAAINGTGNALANTLTGNSGNNVLDGGTGNDTMVGGAGNDTYVVESAGDVITEGASAGTDLVQASISYTLVANVENLALTGTAALNATGNTLVNTLTGNSSDNVLDGGTSADTLIGGAGNDTYVVDVSGDVVTEAASQGTDLVKSAITYTLGSNVENLTLTGTTAINGTGNTLDNMLTGNGVNNTLTGGAGNDTLDGGAGTDTMSGGAGNDVYYVDIAADVTTENANEGIDLVNSAATRTLAANIELLFLAGSTAINGTGNTLANLLRGNAMNNTLVGGGGTDILEGGAGNDTLSNTTGNTLLNGGAGTDTLTGGSNNDLLIGGLGNDALTTGSGADIIAFNKGDGQDTVAVSTTKDNTLSIGGGARYADLLFTKNGNDLVLKVGATDQITLTGYYANAANRSVNRLQMVIEGTADYVPGSTDATKNNKIEIFDFGGLVSAFDAARTANPSLTSWALSGALAAQYVTGSDTAALGGDLAYRYARLGSLSEISFSPAISILGNASFGTAAQTLQPLTGLQDLTPRLN
jgi:Ca2+-binding RTX toxin-like protein